MEAGLAAVEEDLIVAEAVVRLRARAADADMTPLEVIEVVAVEVVAVEAAVTSEAAVAVVITGLRPASCLTSQSLHLLPR